MSKILLTKKLSEDILALFNNTNAELVSIPEGDAEFFAEQIKDADAVLLSTAFKMTEEIINSASNLKVISRTGVGVDNVDVKAATGKGILVLNTPEANSLSVAEHTVTLIAAISKQLLMYDSALRNGEFGIRRKNLCTDLEGKTLGLVGCGKIGRLVAKKCNLAFGMKTIGYDPYITSDIDGIEIRSELEQVFAEADYISIHVPLVESTRNLVDEKLLSVMKPTAYIVNTARGGIINEYALAEALKNNAIAGAALDVLSSEPPEEDNPLLGLNNIILTPHSAALSKECTKRVAAQAAEGIVDFLKGKTPQYVFNKEVLSDNC